MFKGIRDGDYSEVKEKFLNRENEFMQLIFTQLSHELIKINFNDDKISTISSYWDNDVDLDIYAKTASGKIVVGLTTYTNSKVKKSELTKLQEACKKANIKADIFVLVSKKGFTSELKSLKNDALKLYTIKNFKNLL